MKMLCPYCDVEISMSAVDAEDGFCPECGAVISSSSIFASVEELDEDDLALDDDDLDDDF